MDGAAQVDVHPVLQNFHGCVCMYMYVCECKCAHIHATQQHTRMIDRPSSSHPASRTPQPTPGLTHLPTVPPHVAAGQLRLDLLTGQSPFPFPSPFFLVVVFPHTGQGIGLFHPGDVGRFGGEDGGVFVGGLGLCAWTCVSKSVSAYTQGMEGQTQHKRARTPPPCLSWRQTVPSAILSPTRGPYYS